VPTLRTGILQIRPSCPPHETAHNGLEIWNEKKKKKKKKKPNILIK
jgi:hypothetical protein